MLGCVIASGKWNLSVRFLLEIAACSSFPAAGGVGTPYPIWAGGAYIAAAAGSHGQCLS